MIDFLGPTNIIALIRNVYLNIQQLVLNIFREIDAFHDKSVDSVAGVDVNQR